MVGAPGITVTLSRSIRARTFSASNTASGRIVAPRMTAESQPPLYPNEWKKGATTRYRSVWASEISDDQVSNTARF